MSGLEEAVKGALGEGTARAAVTAADIVGAAVDDLCQNYENNVVSVFRPGSKNPTSDYDMMVVMKDGINIQGVSERIKKQLSKYSKEKAFKDVHFFVHRRSDYEDVHNFRPPEVVEPASIENWRGLAPTYQFAWEMRTTNPETDIYGGKIGKEFVAAQKPKAENLHANRGEGLELVLTQTRSLLEALKENSDAAIAKSVLRVSAGIYLAFTGKVMVTDDELYETNMFGGFQGGLHDKAKEIRKEIRKNRNREYKFDDAEKLGLFALFNIARKVAVKLASERLDYIWDKKRKERLADYYAHNTEKLIELIDSNESVRTSPLTKFGAEALSWYVQNGKSDGHRSTAKALLAEISERLPSFKKRSVIYWHDKECIEYTLGVFGRIKRLDGGRPINQEAMRRTLRESYFKAQAEAAADQLLLAEIKLALGGDAEEECARLEKSKTIPHSFNPNLSDIKARIFRQKHDYKKSIQENPTDAETWREWSTATPEQKYRELYSAIASALERDDIASVAFSERSEEVKERLLKPWQEKLMRVSEDALALSEKMRTDCLSELNRFEDLKPLTRERETLINLRKEQILLAENFASDVRTLENCVQPDAYLGVNQISLKKMVDGFWQQFDLLNERYAFVNALQEKAEKEPGPEMLELASTSAKRSALHFGYASAATVMLAGASLAPFVPGSLQVYLQGAIAVALPVFLATGLRLASDIALPRNRLRLKQAFGR